MMSKFFLPLLAAAILLPSVAMAMPQECPSACDRIAGDVDGDGSVGFNDVSAIYRWLYVGRAKGLCIKAADVNGDGAIDLSDAYLLGNFVWNGGPAPVSQSLPGDVNNDGNLDISDIVSLGQWLWGDMGEVCEVNADVNGDGNIDVSDLTVLVQML